MIFDAVIQARTIEVRFASSGKVLKVNKLFASKVNKGELLASLDRKVLQAQLDRQLADYEKIRSDFEIFATKNPNPMETIEKYLKVEKQAALNAAVKEVEIAKMALDECDLFSPVTGEVVDDGGIVEGMYITPASTKYKIIDVASFYVEFEIEQKDILYFRDAKLGKVNIEGVAHDIQVQTDGIHSDGGKFYVRAPLTGVQGLILGMRASIEC